MRVLILGGDGFIGWPAALYLARHGHEVTIFDDFSRRSIDALLDIESLTPIAVPQERQLAAVAEGLQVSYWTYSESSAVDYTRLRFALDRFDQYDAVVHCAEQRAAPYSMKSPAHKRYTVERNVTATHNLLCALVELGLDAHVVHIGSMGVYGYGATGGKVPEGYLPILSADEVNRAASRHQEAWGKLLAIKDAPWHEILHPANPGSIYHMTKCLDQILFAFYAKNDGLRITDLHQGIVWGTETDETRRDPRLINRFDYDGDYGTVLNRFLVQAEIGYPLTVHGTGGQTRAFIHIRDSVECIRLALENPPERGERVKIRNQMTECWSLRELAEMIRDQTGATIAYTPNPRKEDAENDLLVANDSLLRLGLKPTTLRAGLLAEIAATVRPHADRIDRDKIPCRSVWTAEQRAGEPT